MATDKLQNIRPQRANANRHTQRGLGMLEQSIQKDGWIGAITVAADGETFDGSARIEVGVGAGFEDAIVVESDGTKPIIHRRTDIPSADHPRAKRLGVAANRVASVDLEWDTDVLAELAQEGDVLDGLFFEDELADLLGSVTVEGAGGDDFDTTPQDGPTRVQRGDVWRIGVHRLMCGDSTNPQDVERLMGGERAAFVLADPPYNVDYTGGSTNDKERGDSYRDRWADPEYTRWLSSILKNAISHSDDKAALHLWFGTSKMRCIMDAFESAGWEQRALIIWNKLKAHYGALGAQYKHRYEPMFYCFKKGKAPRWYGATNEATVWDEEQPRVNDLHPTMKPISLYERSIGNHTLAKDVVLEMFGGSGTTLIAAHRMSRYARLCEIEPKYCDVILRRAEAEGIGPIERLDGVV